MITFGFGARKSSPPYGVGRPETVPRSVNVYTASYGGWIVWASAGRAANKGRAAARRRRIAERALVRRRCECMFSPFCADMDTGREPLSARPDIFIDTIATVVIVAG